MSTIKLPAASGGGSISIKGPASSGSDVDLLDTSGNLKLSDSDELRLGTGNDLKVYHSGSHSYLQHTTGHPLWIQNITGQAVNISHTDGTDLSAKFNIGGSAELYHDNSKKIETTANGCQLTGQLDIPDGGGGDGANHIRIGSSFDFRLYHDGTNSYLNNRTGILKATTNEFRVENAAGDEVCAKFIADGACELRYNDSAKLTTTNTGITVTGSIFVGTNGEGISFESSNNNGIGGSNITFDDYEEGTYNPTWAGITNYTSGYNTWHYTKIGRLVNVIGQLRCKTTQNDGTDVSFTLPFTPAAQTNAGNTGNFSIGPTMHYNVETGSGNLVTYAYGGNAYGYFYNNQEDSSWWILESQHVAFDESIYVNFTYIT